MVVLKQGFENYILTTADRETSVRTFSSGKCMLSDTKILEGENLLSSPLSPGMIGGRDPWLSAHKVPASEEQGNSGAVLKWGCTATASLPAPLSSTPVSQTLGKGRNRKAHDLVALPYRELL